MLAGPQGFAAPAQVRNLIFLGDRVEMRLEVNGFGPIIARLPTAAYQVRNLAMGEEVTCAFDPGKTTAFIN